MMILASVNPRWENRKPIAVQAAMDARKTAQSVRMRFRFRSAGFRATYTFVP